MDLGLLRRFGDAIALVEESGAEITYAELAERCEAFAELLGGGRRLILLRAANDVDSVVAYLAAQAAGHVVILTGDTEMGSDGDILRTFTPNIICRRGSVKHIGGAAPTALHPDLALLLSTSGSTGSSKLVRLSKRNLQANAGAIVASLGIEGRDRAITSLPFHYSYGMSVLNSHLRAGASIVLTDMSVVDPEFWALFRRTRVTSLAGVPYSYELFERMGLRDDPPESLRVMTQAGGRLAPELVKTYAAFAASRGARFHVMYGQTEASPRMAYLPSNLAAANADCIGIPAPGGSFRILDQRGAEVTAAGVTGELVYRGPNVMMGYASARADLARGPELDELRTGDLALRTRGGLYRVVGRASRFVKIRGLRIGLDDLEVTLARDDRRAYVAGSDDLVAVCVIGDGDPISVREFVAHRCGLPFSAVAVFAAEQEPRLPTGKVDYRTILDLGVETAKRERLSRRGGGVIAEAYATALGIETPPPDATFANLGGDSLSYVNASLGVERVLGQLPVGWEAMSIANLEALAAPRKAGDTGWRWVPTEVIARVVALFLVMANHALPGDGDWLRGGANILFALAGFNLARFQGEALRRGAVVSVIANAVYRVLLPYLLCVSILLVAARREASGSWLLLLGVFQERPHSSLFFYWFIDSLFHALLITCALFLSPPVRRLSSSRPFAFALAMVAAATVVMVFGLSFWNHGEDMRATVDAWLYAYYLGWAAFFARRPWQKALVALLAALITGMQYGFPSSREIFVTIGLSVVMFMPRFKIPNWSATVIFSVAGASYFIYLIHVLPYHVLYVYGSDVHATLLRLGFLWPTSVVLGLVFARVWRSVVAGARAGASLLLGGLGAHRTSNA